jgi:hypothetical protein
MPIIGSLGGGSAGGFGQRKGAAKYEITYLVVAGGGAGNGNAAGGAGGGGLIESTTEVAKGTSYTVTVGAGGVAPAVKGPDSSISGGDLNVVAAGGGTAGGLSENGQTGGAGGGGGAQYDPPVFGAGYLGGAGNTPILSPSQGTNGGNGNPTYPYPSGGYYTILAGGGGGGGGPLAQVGPNASNSVAAKGADGSTSNITGTPTYYAGGGSGQWYPGGSGSPVGGQGGGGIGGPYGPGPVGDGVDGLGGGAGNDGQTRKAYGGSGVVILRIPTASYSGTTTGSPTVTDDGDYKVVKFTGSGSYTA